MTCTIHRKRAPEEADMPTSSYWPLPRGGTLVLLLALPLPPPMLMAMPMPLRLCYSDAYIH